MSIEPSIPIDGNTAAIAVLVLAFIVRELWAWAKRRAERDEAAKEGALAKLEAKIDSLAIDVRANLRELSTTQAQHQADLAVASQRITTLEIEVAKQRDLLTRKAGT